MCGDADSTLVLSAANDAAVKLWDVSKVDAAGYAREVACATHLHSSGIWSMHARGAKVRSQQHPGAYLRGSEPLLEWTKSQLAPPLVHDIHHAGQGTVGNVFKIRVNITGVVKSFWDLGASRRCCKIGFALLSAVHVLCGMEHAIFDEREATRLLVHLWGKAVKVNANSELSLVLRCSPARRMAALSCPS